jgi:3-dehydroquinate dehydratase-2
MQVMASLLVIHGPNLNLLGTREPKYYGSTTLEAINILLERQAAKAGHNVTCFQANAEHILIERIHTAAHENIDFIIINPAAFTHTSIALRDALAAIAIPFIEVHLSNVQGREAFRRYSYFSDIAEGSISGLGPIGYELALQAAFTRLAPP